MSITIAGTACRAAADSTADRTDPRADCRAAPGIRANRSEYCSSGRTPRGSAEWPRRYRLARRRPITWRRWIILRILKRCGRRYCRKHKSSRTRKSRVEPFQLRTAPLAWIMLRRQRVNGNGPLPLFPCRVALAPYWPEGRGSLEERRGAAVHARPRYTTPSERAAKVKARSLPQGNPIMQGSTTGGGRPGTTSIIRRLTGHQARI